MIRRSSPAKKDKPAPTRQPAKGFAVLGKDGDTTKVRCGCGRVLTVNARRLRLGLCLSCECRERAWASWQADLCAPFSEARALVVGLAK